MQPKGEPRDPSCVSQHVHGSHPSSTRPRRRSSSSSSRPTMVRRPSDSSTFRSGFVDLGSGSPPSFWLRGGDSCVLAFVRKAVDISPTARESLRVSWLQVGGDCGGSKVAFSLVPSCRFGVCALEQFWVVLLASDGDPVASVGSGNEERAIDEIWLCGAHASRNLHSKAVQCSRVWLELCRKFDCNRGS